MPIILIIVGPLLLISVCPLFLINVGPLLLISVWPITIDTVKHLSSEIYSVSSIKFDKTEILC